MVKYQLICDQNHEFEGWFEGSAAYDEQVANGLLRCPLCDSDQVKRALMTPNIASPKRRKSDALSANDEMSVNEPAASTTTPSASATLASSQVSHTATRQMAVQEAMQAEQPQAFGATLAELRQLRQKIIKECRDVGDNFAEEARKIHYGEAEAKGIYGQATQEERESLKDEGVEIYNMPWVPSSHEDEAVDGVRQRPMTHEW